jgi:hypothetical protein
MAPNCGSRVSTGTRLALLFILILLAISAGGVQTINLRAEAVSESQIRLSCRINHPGAFSTIRIYQTEAPSPRSFNILTSVTANVSSFIDKNLPAGIAYDYQVRTAQSGGVLMSAPSNTAKTFSGGGVTPAHAPRQSPSPTPAPGVTRTPNPAPTPTPGTTPALPPSGGLSAAPDSAGMPGAVLVVNSMIRDFPDNCAIPQSEVALGETME